MNIADIQATAKAIVASKMFAGVTNENEALVKILAGQELGLGPVASINGLYSLNGKIGMMASVAGALLQKYGYRWDIVWDDVDNPTACEVTFFHSSLPPSGWTNRFTVADAMRAKLIKQDGAHQKYPKDMLFNRCFMAGARKVAPSVLLNMGYEYDELREAAPQGTPPLPVKHNDTPPKPAAAAPAAIAGIPTVTMDTIDCPLHPGTEARLNKWGSAYSHPTAGKTPEGKTVWCNTKIDKTATKPSTMPNPPQIEPQPPPAWLQGEPDKVGVLLEDMLANDETFKQAISDGMKVIKWGKQDLLDYMKPMKVSKLSELSLGGRVKVYKHIQELVDLANA